MSTSTPRPFSCGGCRNRWSGLARAHCPNCHLTFNGITTADKHRIGDIDHRRCRTPHEMAGLPRPIVPDDDGYWGEPKGTDTRWAS